MDRFTLEIDGVDGLRVTAFDVDERISAPYRARVFALLHDTAIASLDGVLGQRGALTVPGAGDAASLHFPGLVTAVELVHTFGEQALVEVVLRPTLWGLGLERHSRVWVKKKVLDVLAELLDKGGVAHEMKTEASYVEHEHVCQYRETDLDFIARSLERDGLHYYFELADGEDKLVVSDGPHATDLHPPSPVRCVGSFDAGAAGSVGESLHGLAARRSARSKEVEVADYYYPKPALALRERKAVIDPALGTVIAFGGQAWSPAEAKRLAQVRAEQAAAEAVLFRATGTVLGLRAGYRFEVGEHPVGGLLGEYRAVGVRHVGFDAVAGRGLEGWIDPDRDWLRTDGSPYRVSVEAVRADVPYRAPRKTPWPRAHGLEHARVDGAADGEYAQLDDQGRYRVKLLFDENDSPAGEASALLRLMQPHGGAPEGCHFPLRKGTEVLVAFLEGDPDQPVLVGAVPNPETPSTVTEANNTQNVIQTGGKNRIEVEDQAGSEYVVLYSPPEKTTLHLGASDGPYADGHHVRLSTDCDAKIHAGGARHITIGGEQTEDVTGRVVEDYHSDQTTHVYAAFDETIDGSATQTIHAGETRTVTGGLTETITGDETRSVAPDQTEDVSASVTRTIGANWTETVGAAVDRTIGADETISVGGNVTQTIAGGVTTSTPAALSVTTGGSATFIAPAGFVLTAPGGFHNVDGEWVKTGGWEKDAFVEKASLVGLKLEIMAVAASVAISRISATTMKIAYIATEFEAETDEEEDAPLELCEGGLLLEPSGNHSES
ncbi:MAG: type VI secretion system tip protein VgrG [Polyangiaceae bacterium]|nr:type VI secretion system tip protein VgrG [Polyangiaceae bacterium]